MKCKRELSWAGRCTEDVMEGSLFCEEHSKVFCGCGKVATQECGVASSLTCGHPLCDDCVCPGHGRLL